MVTDCACLFYRILCGILDNSRHVQGKRCPSQADSVEGNSEPFVCPVIEAFGSSLSLPLLVCNDT